MSCASPHRTLTTGPQCRSRHLSYFCLLLQSSLSPLPAADPSTLRPNDHQTCMPPVLDPRPRRHWFAGGGGLCTASMSVADCSYRRLLMRHIKVSLQTCDNPLTPSPLSLAHRGVPLVYPEHTVEGYLEALSLGAQWIECDVVVTRDFQLVCRHDQCDLADTTNVLSIPALAAKCSVPGEVCCAYDLTLAEFSSLCGVSYDASNPHLRLFSWTPGDAPEGCRAHPATLGGMAALVVRAGGSLIPEQKNCDLMCQARAHSFPAPAGRVLSDEMLFVVTEPSPVLNTLLLLSTG